MSNQPDNPPATDTKPITEFRGEHWFLSNFWPCRVFLAPHWYPSVEHAYQAAKTTNWAIRDQIKNADSAAVAKRLGQQIECRKDWPEIKLDVMADLLWQKFVLDPGLRQRLLETGDRDLIEGNNWNDTYWGVCNGVGQNHLGRLQMQLRSIARYLSENSRKITVNPEVTES